MSLANTVRTFLIISLFVGVWSHGLYAQDTTRVLFVGNSFTYFYNVPQGVEAMAAQQGVALQCRQSTVGGSTLEQHWLEKKGTQTRKRLEEEPWDIVVLQNHSLSSIRDSASFMEYGMKFAEEVRSKGAEPVFMMTWAYDSNPLMQDRIRNMYQKLAALTDAGLIPVGSVFEQCRIIRPDIDLFFDDKHPSEIGSYLVALTCTQFLTEKTVMRLPNRITTQDRNGEKLYLFFLHAPDADYLQQLVDTILKL